MRPLGLFVLATVLVAGCGPAGGVPVRGTVTFDGAPVPAGVITFVGPDSGPGVYGGPVRDGRYEVPADRLMPAGRYRVQVSWPKPTGKTAPGGEGGSPMPEMAEAIPAKYNTATELTADVRPGSAAVDFALTR
jgi:hypothetical protein